MIVLGVLFSIIITLIPGYMLLRLFRNDTIQPLKAFMYAVGLGVVFNIIVGFIANFTFGFTIIPVAVVYLILFGVLSVLSYKFGKYLPFDWEINWKSASFIIPTAIYLLAVGLQLQTTLMSPNLVGSDVHLEYYYSNMTLENGYWDAMLGGVGINVCLGVTLLLPVYSLLTGLDMLWVYKIICPLIFAILPLALYVIYSEQFGKVVAVLSVIFFVTLPMFTMDMLQLIRQQQSEVFLILVFLLLFDDSMTVKSKVILGMVFSLGLVVTHYGLPVGYMGYLLSGLMVLVAIKWLWRKKRELADIGKSILPKLATMGVILIVTLAMYIGYYGWVHSGQILVIFNIPMTIVEKTVDQTTVGVTTIVDDITDAPEEVPIPEDKPIPQEIPAPEDKPIPAEVPIPEDQPVPEEVKPQSILNHITELFPFLDQVWREPLLQMTIGLDFERASALGKVWRVLQYLVEICLVVGFVVFFLKPNKKIKLEYVAFAISSLFIVVGMYITHTYSYGLGASRVFQVSLLFLSPMFVIGVSAIGACLVRIVRKKVLNRDNLIICSTLILFVPYFVFNFGIVFELAKLQPVGYIDIPYSIALSGHRVDIATVFDKEDVEAVDWLKEYISKTDDTRLIFGDTHGTRLLGQLFGFNVKARGGIEYVGELLVVGTIRSLNYITEDDTGYIFLRKLNVERNIITFQAEYASRLSYPLDELELIKKKIESGRIIFDNGAKIILVTE